MNEIAAALKKRTMVFALRVMKFCRTLPDNWEGRFIADQLFRAGSRTGANYRAACRAKSHRDFTNKMGSVVEECDESEFWLTFIGLSDLNNTVEQKDLHKEANELLAIFAQSWKTASGNDQ